MDLRSYTKELLTAKFPTIDQDLFPLLNILSFISLPESEKTRSMSEQVRFEQTQSLMLKILCTLLPPHSLIVLQNIQWLQQKKAYIFS